MASSLLPLGVRTSAANLLLLALLLCSTAPAQSQPGGGRSGSSRSAPAEEGVRWQRLKPAQREALKPLQQEWPQIDAARKQKWIELADRLPGMPAEERARIQGRMADWAELTPSE